MNELEAIETIADAIIDKEQSDVAEDVVDEATSVTEELAESETGTEDAGQVDTDVEEVDETEAAQEAEEVDETEAGQEAEDATEEKPQTVDAVVLKKVKSLEDMIAVLTADIKAQQKSQEELKAEIADLFFNPKEDPTVEKDTAITVDSVIDDIVKDLI